MDRPTIGECERRRRAEGVYPSYGQYVAANPDPEPPPKPKPTNGRRCERCGAPIDGRRLFCEACQLEKKRKQNRRDFLARKLRRQK